MTEVLEKVIKKVILLLFVNLVALCVVGNASGEFGSSAKPTTDRLKPELVLQTGHNSLVNAVVIAPDNSWIASGSVDSTIKIWDSASGRELRTLSGHDGTVKALAVNPNGLLLVSSGTDKTVRIWNVATGQLLKQLFPHDGTIDAIAFSPDGRFLATSGGADNAINIWDISDYSNKFTLSKHAARITCLNFSPDGKFLAFGSSDNVVNIWEIGKKRSSLVLKKHTGEISVIAFSPDGQFIATGSADNTIILWKVGKEREKLTFTGHKNKIFALSFNSAQELMSFDGNGQIKYWNILNGREIKAIDNLAEASADEIQSAIFNPTGKLLIIGWGDRTVTLTDLEQQLKLQTFKPRTTGFYGVAFSTDMRWFAAGSSDDTIKLWDLQTGASIAPLVGHQGFVSGVAFPENDYLISASADGTIKVWDIIAAKAVRTLSKHTDQVSGIAVARKSPWLASGSKDQTIKLWNWRTGEEIQTFKEHSGEVTSVAFSPNEQLIASGSDDKTIKLWDVAGKNPTRTLADHMGAVESVAFSPDGKLLASGSTDKTVKIWEVATGKLIKTLTNHTDWVHTVVFSKEGNLLFSGGRDKTVRVWNFLADREEKTLSDHTGTIYSLTFSDNGKWLVSGSEDGSNVIWQKESAKKVATLLSLRESNDWLVASPDGSFDGSPDAWNRILWRFEQNTFNVSPVEVFFDEFFRPGLLADLLADKQTLTTVPNITEKDRRQPELKITAPGYETNGSAISERKIKLKIKAAEAPRGNGYSTGSGVRDVRLFRNGSLVHLWKDDVLAGKTREVELEKEVTLVEGQNQFTVYAFNKDNVKSRDYSLNLTGAENLKRRGTVYLIAVGVGRYANRDYNLESIDMDVASFTKTLGEKQNQLNLYEKIEFIPLLDEGATKKNILTALHKLAGKNDGAPAAKLPQAIAELPIAQPEDIVVVYFSGHGTAKNDRFYMLPHDLGYMGSRKSPTADAEETILKNSISDLDLADAFLGIDVKHLIFVVDACRSGQAIKAEDNRQGPMNAKGLAQLAYEKGMYILTASQDFEDSYTSKTLGRSYLTYALVEDGLKNFLADASQDGRLLLREWFDYTISRVPQLRQETLAKISQTEQNKGLGLRQTKTIGVQRPRVFYRRQIELNPLLVAKN
jgi:WD40 repeat protein